MELKKEQYQKSSKKSLQTSLYMAVFCIAYLIFGLTAEDMICHNDFGWKLEV